MTKHWWNFEIQNLSQSRVFTQSKILKDSLWRLILSACLHRLYWCIGRIFLTCLQWDSTTELTVCRVLQAYSFIKSCQQQRICSCPCTLLTYVFIDPLCRCWTIDEHFDAWKLSYIYPASYIHMILYAHSILPICNKLALFAWRRIQERCCLLQEEALVKYFFDLIRTQGTIHHTYKFLSCINALNCEPII